MIARLLTLASLVAIAVAIAYGVVEDSWWSIAAAGLFALALFLGLVEWPTFRRFRAARAALGPPPLRGVDPRPRPPVDAHVPERYEPLWDWPDREAA